MQLGELAYRLFVLNAFCPDSLQVILFAIFGLRSDKNGIKTKSATINQQRTPAVLAFQNSCALQISSVAFGAILFQV